MSFYSKLVKNISFPIIAKINGLSNLVNYMNQLDESQYWSQNIIAEHQFNKLKALFIHAYNNTKLYKNRFDAAGFNPYKFNDLDEIKRIPPLTKKDLQTNLKFLVANNYNENEIHKDATGGSTGTNTSFYRDNGCIGFKKAIEYRCNRWAGWDIGDKISYYWPAIQDFASKKPIKSKIKNILTYRALMLYAGRLDKKILEEHYKQLALFKPSLIRVFPNALSILAKYIKDNNKERIYIPSIISVGEPLLENQRELFFEVFGSKVYNCYVSRECGNMACECEEHNQLHINSEMVYIEFSANNENKFHTPNKILVTDLINYGMPFIRYQIEDLGIPVKGECTCGRKLPLMKMGAGRISDFLISPYDKSMVSGCSVLHHMIAEGPEVGQVQVIQDKIDHLNIRILKSVNFSEDKLSHFNDVIDNIFKNRMRYDIEYVENIAKEKSGKYLFTKCLLPKNDLLE